MSEGVIKIRGDLTELTKALEKSGVQFQTLGAHAEKTAGHARTFSQQWEHANQHMVRTAIHAISIGGALHEALHTMEEFQAEAEKASKTLDEMRLKSEGAAGRLKIDPERFAAYTGGDSPVAKTQRVDFAASLSERDHVGRVRRKPSEGEIAKATSIYNSGMVSEKEINEALDRGTLDSINVGERVAKLTPEGRAARDALVSINRNTDAAEENLAGEGRQDRVAGANFDRIASSSWFLRIPGIKQILAASYKAQGLGPDNPGQSFGQTLSEGGMVNAPEGGWGLTVKKAVESQTEALKPPPTVGEKPR